jgi:hypothetical protein
VVESAAKPAPKLLDHIARARKPKRVPVVLTRREIAAVLDQLTGTY